MTLARAACLAAVFVLGQTGSALAQSPAQPLRVALTVTASSWMEEAAFNYVAAFNSCASEGIVFVPDAGAALPADGVAGTVRIRYHATQGRRLAGASGPAGFGTKIDYRMEFRSRRATPDRLVLEARSETPPDHAGGSAAEAAVDALKRQPEYRLTCSVIAAALGSEEAKRYLLPWAVVAARGAGLLKAMGFAPSSPEDMASWAVAQRRFDDAVALGPAAVAPLSLLFVSTSPPSANPRSSGGRLDPGAQAATLVRAAAALAAIGDARATSALLVFLHDRAAEPDTRELDEVVTAVLDVLGRLGNELSIPVLEEWRLRRAPVGPAADRALASARQRAAVTTPP
jgi:hypothetical protein